MTRSQAGVHGVVRTATEDSLQRKSAMTQKTQPKNFQGVIGGQYTRQIEGILIIHTNPLQFEGFPIVMGPAGCMHTHDEFTRQKTQGPTNSI